MTSSEATQADEKGSAALLARLDPPLVAEAAHEAMKEELLALDAQLRKAVDTLSSVRSMTAALTRVERLKAERLHKEVREADIRDLDGLCETLGVRMDALVTKPRVNDALPAQAQEGFSENTEPPGGVERPTEASAGPTGGEMPTENSEETGEEEAPSTQTSSLQSLAKESQMPPSGTTKVHEEDKQDGNTPLDIKKQEGGASGDTDVVNEPMEPPSNEEELQIRTRSPPQQQKKEVETPTTQPEEQVTPVSGITQSQRISAPAGADIDVKIDTTNIRTFARTCLERVNQINKRASFEISTLYVFAAFLKILLTAVEKMHLQRVADGLPLLDGDVITDSVKATELLIQIISVVEPKDLTLVPLHMQIRSPLSKATHPKLIILRSSLQGQQNVAKIIANVVPSRFNNEIASHPWKNLLWSALVYLTQGTASYLPWWIEFFEKQLRPGHPRPAARYPIPLVFLVLAIVVHRTIQLKPSQKTAALAASLTMSCDLYEGPDPLQPGCAAQMRLSEAASPFMRAIRPFDFQNEIAYIQTNLAWVYERRRSRKRSREE